jgi:exopolysaccharide production protein ExoQ
MTIDPSIRRLAQERPYSRLSLIFLFLLVLGVVARLDLTAFFVIVALPAIPFVIFVVLRGLAGHKTYGATLSVLVIFVLSANFRNRNYADKDIDIQVALKLAAIAALFALSILFVRQIFSRVNGYGALSWLSFLAYTIATCIYAINPTPAFVSTVSLFGGFLFICYLCINYGRAGAINLIVVAAAILYLGSLAVYFAVPSLGRMRDWVGGELVETSRLQGLFGSPNGAGLSAALGLFLVIAFYAGEPGHSRALAWVAALSAFLCLIFSNNRMAMFALVVSVSSLYLLNRVVARRALLLSTIALLGVSSVTLFADQLLALVSRSGSWGEIMSATGRSRIWPVVIELWSQTPILGRGYGSALYILPTHPDLFTAAAHAHSLYLEQLFSGGIIGLGLFVCSILVTTAVAWRRSAAREWSLLLFFLVYGLTEPVVSGPISFALIVMFMTIVLILLDARPQPSAVVSGQIGELATEN